MREQLGGRLAARKGQPTTDSLQRGNKDEDTTQTVLFSTVFPLILTSHGVHMDLVKKSSVHYNHALRISMYRSGLKLQ